MIVVSDKLSTESFHAFIDEQLDNEQYLQVEEQLDEFPEKVEEIQQCQIINERLREVFDSIVEEEVPSDLYNIALHGVTADSTEDEQAFQQYGYEFDEDLNEITGYQDEVNSPLDSMNSALELQDEEFIDNDEFADLEALSGQESLADFDIDAISGNNQGIIPDIFDEEEAGAMLNAGVEPPPKNSNTDDEAMLSSLESLSLEPLDANMQSHEEPAVASENNIGPEDSMYQAGDMHPETHPDDSNVSNEIDVPELTLEPLEQDQAEQDEHQDGHAFVDARPAEQTELREQIEAQDEQSAAREKVLESLEASEDLILEPVDSGPATEAIQLPADFSDQINAVEDQGSPVDKTEAETGKAADSNEHYVLAGAGNMQPEPDEVAGELAEDEQALGAPQEVSTEPEAEIQAELKTGSDVSDEDSVEPANSAEEPLHLKEKNPADPEYPIDEIVNELDEMPNGENEVAQGVPQDVVAEFFEGSKTEPDFEVSEVVKHFDEVSDDFAAQNQGPFDSPVAQIKQKADSVLNVINNKFYAFKKNVLNREDDDFPDFNKAPVLPDIESGQSVYNKRENPAEDIPSSFDFDGDSGLANTESAGLETESHISKPLDGSPDGFDFDIGIDGEEEATPDRKSKNIGDTLRSYKEQRQNQGAGLDYTSGDATNADTGNALVHYEELTGFAKYKYLAQHTADKVSPENRMTIGGVILLVIGLIIGGSVTNLMSDPAGNLISAAKVERLAIDAHILYTQQNQNFAGNPSTSITESMQWLSARIGKHIRLADVQPEEFKHQRAMIIPTMVSYATANIFENKNKERITLFIAAGSPDVSNSDMTCRIPTGVDGLCSWVKDSMFYIVIGNLSLSRVRAFSQEMFDKL